MEYLYAVVDLPPLEPLKEDDEVTTELSVKDYLAEWRHVVDI